MDLHHSLAFEKGNGYFVGGAGSRRVEQRLYVTASPDRSISFAQRQKTIAVVGISTILKLLKEASSRP